MTKRLSTQKVNAPRHVVSAWRKKFPKLRDSDVIGVMWNTSLLKVEAALRVDPFLPRPEKVTGKKNGKKTKRII